MTERRTPIALLEDRANRVDKALAHFGDTAPGATPPSTLRALCAALRERLEAAEARLLKPAGQLSISEIMERALRGGQETVPESDGPLFDRHSGALRPGAIVGGEREEGGDGG